MPQPSEDPGTPAPDEQEARDEDLVPRPSKMRYLALLFAGIFIGRIASTNFSSGALDLLDLVMYVGLALSLAWAWRSWARQAMVQRRLAAERRRQRAASSLRPPRQKKR